MIKTLRRKFVLISMGALALILLVMVGVLNLVNYSRVQRNADDLLMILAENGGEFPRLRGVADPVPLEPPPAEPGGKSPVKPPAEADGKGSAKPPAEKKTPPEGRENKKEPRQRGFGDNELFGFSRTEETPFATRWFWVCLDAQGKEVLSDVTHIASIDATKAVTMAQAVFSSGRMRGSYGDYRYLIQPYIDHESLKNNASVTAGSSMIVFLDWHTDIHNVRLLLAVSVLISIAMLLLMLLLTVLFSPRAVAATVEAFEKQKRFVSDASHELKTPLTVISADVDVMEMTGEKNEWTSSIRDQVARMNRLIRDMLTLSRLEEDRIKVVFCELDLTDVVRKAAEPFFVVARTAGRSFETDLGEGIRLMGDADELSQLVSILADNAIKYAGENGSIQLKLKKESRVIRLEIANTCDRLPEGNLDRLFDRFYRADASRNRGTGGFGIGLSIARAITESHGGKIHAERDGDRIIRFIAQFPIKNLKEIKKV